MIKEITGKHVAFFFVVFFGIIFTINGYMIYKSQSSWTGLETHDAYRKGLKYNQKLSVLEAQNTRGWEMNLKHEDLSNGGFALTAVPKDDKGERLAGLKMSAKLVRPTHEGMDKDITLSETAPGVYSGKTDQILRGKWYLNVTAARRNETLYRSKNVLYLK